ncbi:putative molybdenum carrier protein [Thermodesulfobacteriota bacterium]
MLKKIISGGQTGADRAALDVAIKLGIPHGGWVPKGRIAEDGVLSYKYRLHEMPEGSYLESTSRNIIHSGGTLIISHGPLTEESALTHSLAARYRRPCLHINLDNDTITKSARTVAAWVKVHRIETLNVAGQRASTNPRIYQDTLFLLQRVFGLLLRDGYLRAHQHYESINTSGDDFIDEIISELSLKDKVLIANMDKIDVAVLKDVFDRYARDKIDTDSDDEETDNISLELWKRLRDTHKLRVVK